VKICVVLLALGWLVGCYEPVDQRPGTRLSGEVVEVLPESWEFSDAHREIAVEVETPYLVPHSVTIWCATLDGDLYIGARDPETKKWPDWAEQGDVRLKIGDRVYDVSLARVDDEGLLARIRGAYARKYQLGEPSGPSNTRYWAVRPAAS